MIGGNMNSKRIDNDLIDDRIKDKFRGALVGLMIGDALGAPFEMSARSSIEAKKIINANNRLMYTDDTQLTFGLTESLIEKKTIMPVAIFNRFAINFHEMPIKGYSIRFSALLQDVADGNELLRRIRNNSRSCGAAMRIAPVALAYYDRMDLLEKRVIEASEVTHNTPEAIASAVAVAFIIAQNIEMNHNCDIKILLENTRNFISDIYPEFAKKLDVLYGSLNSSILVFLQNIGCSNPYFGANTKAVEAIPAAIYHFARHYQDYEEGVVAAISTGGDTDTISAITGALIGSLLGFSGIPQDLRNKPFRIGKGIEYAVFLADQIHSIKCREGFK